MLNIVVESARRAGWIVRPGCTSFPFSAPGTPRRNGQHGDGCLGNDILRQESTSPLHVVAERRTEVRERSRSRPLSNLRFADSRSVSVYIVVSHRLPRIVGIAGRRASFDYTLRAERCVQEAKYSVDVYSRVTKSIDYNMASVSYLLRLSGLYA